MRVILEQGDKPEVRSLIYSLQKCGLEFVIVEDHSKQEYWLLSDDEIKAAILELMPFFSVKTQWVAVYRILVDFCGFPAEVAAFCKRINKLIRGTKLCFPIDYQSIQKPLATKSILQKSYRHWKVYCAKKGDRFFARQMMAAERLLKALRNA